MLDQVQEVIRAILEYFQSGFSSVNAAQGLIIGAVAAYVMPQWRRLPVIVACAVIGHVALDVMLPVLAKSGSFRLPPLLEVDYWRYLLQLYAGFLVVVSVFYLVKSLLVQGGGHQHGH